MLQVLTVSKTQPRFVRVNKHGRVSGQKQSFTSVQTLLLSLSACLISRLASTSLFILGCLKEVYVNDKLVDFLQAAKTRHKVSPGCQLYPEELPPMDTQTDPCKDHQCKKGECRAKETGQGYECKCKRGYKGQFCEVRSKYQVNKNWRDTIQT